MAKKQIVIGIGGYHASRLPVVIKTLLGSCVAVCLWDQQRKIGGMNHIQLPGEADLKHFNAPARFGVNAMELLINKMMRVGGRKDALIAKIFGGASVLPWKGKPPAPGKKNVAFVKSFLELEGIPVVAENTGGTDTRTIFFHTDTGSVYLKRTVSRMAGTNAAKEELIRRKLRQEMKKTTEVHFFDVFSR